ncbi:uncharacterized protein LOC120178226 [Hibiscus syriacus]|uniref:uncharacterized protein LOC120178226 n=1 Tax=Hibiscus syriacus TaxID=106335 RepID=UPI0019213D0F|nr:uncharacterized protein LOC120178226 [Hibiscus syriacus]
MPKWFLAVMAANYRGILKSKRIRSIGLNIRLWVTQQEVPVLFGSTNSMPVAWKLGLPMPEGKDKVWCLYPNQNTVPKTFQDAFSCQSSADMKCAYSSTNNDRPLNFVLIDGTWSNSAAMFRRLKSRPQPSWDRTCTAAAAIGVLSELQLLPECSIHGLDKQADAVEDALVVLLEALTTRRLRMGRSITRKVRHSRDIC